MLRLQCDHATYLLDNFPEIPRRIIEGLVSALMSHISVCISQNSFKDYKNVCKNYLLVSGLGVLEFNFILDLILIQLIITFNNFSVTESYLTVDLYYPF